MLALLIWEYSLIGKTAVPKTVDINLSHRGSSPRTPAYLKAIILLIAFLFIFFPLFCSKLFIELFFLTYL